MKYHPDQGGDQEKFKEINEAYQVLGDDAKRRQYDQFGHAAGGNGGFGGGAKKIVGPDGPLPTTACPVCRGLFIEPPISPSGATCVLCGQPAGPSHANTLCGPLIRHRRRSHE
jgi:hypothetical protein